MIFLALSLLSHTNCTESNELFLQMNGEMLETYIITTQFRMKLTGYSTSDTGVEKGNYLSEQSNK